MELVKGFVTLRNDDLKGAMMKSVQFGEKYFSMQLRRTQVTGAGHKMSWLQV